MPMVDMMPRYRPELLIIDHHELLTAINRHYSKHHQLFRTIFNDSWSSSADDHQTLSTITNGCEPVAAIMSNRRLPASNASYYHEPHQASLSITNQLTID